MWKPAIAPNRLSKPKAFSLWPLKTYRQHLWRVPNPEGLFACRNAFRTMFRFQDILRCFWLCLFIIYRVFCCLFRREGRCDNMRDIMWQYCWVRVRAHKSCSFTSIDVVYVWPTLKLSWVYTVLVVPRSRKDHHKPSTARTADWHPTNWAKQAVVHRDSL